MKKRMIAVFLSLCLLLALLPSAALAADTTDSGTCGANLTWKIADGVLTISGTGAMTDYSAESPAPWTGKTFAEVSIANGVTSIGSYAFPASNYVTEEMEPASIHIPRSVTAVADNAIGKSTIDATWDPYIYGYAGTAAETYADKVGLPFVDEDTQKVHGVCRDGLNWSIEDGTLTIYGEGAMDESFEMYAGAVYVDAIKDLGLNVNSVEIGEGVTNIGWHAFFMMDDFSITIPPNVKTIDGYAFFCCENIEVAIEEGLEEIGSYAYLCADNLVIPASVKTIDYWGLPNVSSVTILGDPEIDTGDEMGNCFGYGGINEDLTIYGYTGTKVEAFANENDRVTFVPLDAEEEVCDGGKDCPSHSYTDIDASKWYHKDVDYVIKAGLMIGDGDGTFRPEAKLTRAEMVQILYNRAGQPAVSGTPKFSDVPSNEWYAKAVIWATENEVTFGYGDGKFGPDDPVTREQIATMLYRDAGEPATNGSLSEFPDGNTASEWALPALKWAEENKVLRGDDVGTLRPVDSAKRCEIAAMLRRYIEE